jgi:tol-pal system-associated acyl-CoA thioesterase
MKDFLIEKRIYYHDTDAGGVVYYANYLKYLEESRTEHFLNQGINLKELAERDLWFVVARVNVSYKSPAYYQDTIKITSAIETIKLSSVQFHQQIFRGHTLLVEAKTTLVSVNKNFKPKPIPNEVKSLLLQSKS